MANEKRRARVTISGELLAEMLFPKGTSIVGIREVRDMANDRVDLELVVEHRDLRMSLAGYELPIATPGYRRVNESGLAQIEFMGWNQ